MYIHYQIIQNFILKTVYYAHFIFLNKFVVNSPCILPALLHNPPLSPIYLHPPHIPFITSTYPTLKII